MKERARLSSGNMLLLELLFALIFFSLTLAVTLSVFGNAYVLSREAEGRDLAVAEANDVAEIIRSAKTLQEINELLEMKGLSADSSGRYRMDYGDGRYSMVLDETVQGRLFTGEISCYKTADADSSEETPVYELTVEHAIKEAE